MKRKLICILLLLALCLSLATAAAAAEGYVFDEAGLLTDSQRYTLEVRLEEASRAAGAGIFVATVPGIKGDVDAYVSRWYDDMAFGSDGVLLLVCMSPREYRILSDGFAADAIGMREIDAIGSAIVSDLSAGDYAAAFDTYAEKCGYYLEGYRNGFPFDLGKHLLIALAVGLGAGLITVLVLYCQLKSVHRQDRAGDYVKRGSMKLTASHDFFLYRNVRRTKKESSSGGGSRSSRNIGGGSF